MIDVLFVAVVRIGSAVCTSLLSFLWRRRSLTADTHAQVGALARESAQLLSSYVHFFVLATERLGMPLVPFHS